MGTYSFKVGNQEFQSLGTGSSLQEELMVPWLGTRIAISGSWEFLAMVTYGSMVGNQKFKSMGTGSSLQWEPMVPRLGTWSSDLWEQGVPCNGNLWFQGWEPRVPISGNRQVIAIVFCVFEVRNDRFELLETGVACNGNLWFLAWELADSNFGTRPLSKTNRSVPDQ